MGQHRATFVGANYHTVIADPHCATRRSRRHRASRCGHQRGVAWFGDRVVWLGPDTPEPFRQLTAAISARWPAAQPYEGVFDEVVPHLTIGHDHPVADLKAAADDVSRHLPIRARASTIRLITGRSAPGATWSALADFPLG